MTTPVDLNHHGDAELAPGLLDLAVNVRPGPPPPWLAAAVLSACARLDTYPDPAAATAAIATRHLRAADEVLPTAGGAEAFTLVAHGLDRGRAAIVHPQFTEPERALRAAGWQIERVLLAPGEQLRPELVPDGCDLVVVGNPTNPTGTLHSSATLRALRRPDRVVMVDEAFADAVPGEPESLAAAEDLTGLLIVRSLTKSWGLAGLRVGYLLGEPALIARCAAVQPHWSVSAPALAAAAACSTPAAVSEAAQRARRLATERERFAAGLAARGCHLVPGAVGSFVLTRHPALPDLHAALRQCGIAVRRADTFPGLAGGWVRASVRDAAATDRLLATLDALLAGTPAPPRLPGRVTLVGGGPGADGLISVDGLLALARADVVVTDRLAPLGLLAHLRPGTEVIDAAKNPRGRAMPQPEINRLLVEHANAGRNVVRLKGGDPYVFGRGFEEAQACRAAGIAVQVLPGVTSAVAAPAAAGIPVTHRGVTHAVTIVSGHLPPGHPDSLVDWPALARSGATLVVLMGVATLPAIATALQRAGMPAGTPAAVIADAGAPAQREVRGTLTTIAADANAAGIAPPAVAVIGTVAGLRP